MNLIASLFPLGYVAMIFLIVAGFRSQDWRGFLLGMVAGIIFSFAQIELLRLGIGIDLATTGHSIIQDTLSGTILISIMIVVICAIAGIRRLSTQKSKPKDPKNGSK